MEGLELQQQQRLARMDEMQQRMDEQNKAIRKEHQAMKEQNAALRRDLHSLQQQGAFSKRGTDGQEVDEQEVDEQTRPLVIHGTSNRNTETDIEVEPFGDEETVLGDGLFKSNKSLLAGQVGTSSTRSRGIVADEDGNVALLEDTFSFLIASKPGSVPFTTGFLVFLLKNVTFTLVVMNLIDMTKIFNKLNIPVAVDFSVMLSQFLAFMISVFTQNDLVNALIHLFKGYDISIKETYGRDGRGGGSRAQWVLSLACAFIDGLFGLAVTFLLVVTSSTVLDVLLNFAAVEFVSGLDEAAFFLAQMGFIGKKNQEEAKVVTEFTYKPAKMSQRKKQWMGFVQTAGLVVVLLIVMSFWGILQYYQQTGKYCAKKIIVQFDDQIRPGIGAHSGSYSLQTVASWSPTNRFRYVEDRAGGGRFAHCQALREWRFIVGEGDQCDDTAVLAKSIKTQSLNLLDVAFETWFVVRATSNHFIPMVDFLMDIGCERDSDCGGTASGRCVSNSCQCADDRFGLRCDYSHNKTCTDLQLDERFEPAFPAVRVLSTSYTAVSNNALAYERPIFYNSDTNDVLLFTGVRWAITSLKNVVRGYRGVKNGTADALLQTLDDGTFFAGDITSIDMMSVPIAYQTVDDLFSTPIGIEWELVPIPDDINNIDLIPTANPVQLLCTICNGDNNLCSYSNTCSASGQCVCDDRSTGVLCQLPPTGDGYCDEKFNGPEFGYDGGDCCSSTCVGDQCGLTKAGKIPSIRVGFPYCEDPAAIGDPTNPSLPLYIRNANQIEALSFRGRMVPTLSANGEILLVGEPNIRIVRVFDLVGSNWNQRGRTLQGGPKSDFGFVSAIATPDAGVVRSPTGLVPVMLAIAEPLTGKIHTFDWPEAAADWKEAPSIEITHPVGDTTESSIYPGARLLMSFLYGEPLGGSVNKSITVVLDNGAGVLSFDGPRTDSVCIFTRDFIPIPQNEFVGGCDGFVSDVSISTDGNRIIQIRENAATSDSLEESFPEYWSLHHDKRTVFPATSTSHDSFVPPGAKVVHLADASTAIKSPEAPLRRGRGYTLVLEHKRQGTTSITLLYRPGIKDYQTAAQLNTGEQNVEATIQLPKDTDLSNVVSSRDGTAVTLYPSSGTPLTFVLHPDRHRWMEISMRGVDYPKQDFPKYGSALSVSDGGRHLAASTPGVVQTYSTRRPLCDSNEVAVRLGIFFDQDPEQVGWDVFFETDEGTREKIASCSQCYNWQRNLYAWTAASTDICVPRANLGCVKMTITGSFTEPINGFAAFVLNGTDTTLVATASGSEAGQNTVYSLNDTVADGRCDSTSSSGPSPGQ